MESKSLFNFNNSRLLSSQNDESTTTSENDLIKLDFVFTSGIRRKSNMVWVPSQKQIYRKNTLSKIGTSYKCYHSGCPIRVYIKNNECFALPSNDTHLHGTNDTLYEKMTAMNEMKTESFNSRDKSTRDIFFSVKEKYPNLQISFEEIQRTLQRVRNERMPAPPKSIEDIINAFNIKNVMEEFGTSKYKPDEKTPFFKHAHKYVGSSFCVFASDAIIKMMNENIAESSRIHLLDGTFKVVPCSNFSQLLIIHTEYLDKIFPFIFVLVDQKSEESYSTVFQYINENICSLKCKIFLTDYDISIRNALKKTFGDECEYQSSWFHFTQAVKIYASKISGFYDCVLSNQEIEELYYKFHALPLLPANVVKEGFFMLKATASDFNKEPLNKFILYYERQWIKKEGLTIITEFEKYIRTTSLIEDYHCCLNKKIVPNGNFYKFVSVILSEECRKADEFSSLIQAGGIHKPKRKNAIKNRNYKILEALKELGTGKINLSVFLQRMAFHNKKLVPNTVIDINNSAAPAYDVSDIEDNESDPVERPSTSTLPFGTCSVCQINFINTVLFPCEHTICHECWKIIRERFISIDIKMSIDEYIQMETSEMEMPDELLPKCPNCRNKVRRHDTIFV